jgi:hypothetical protein
METTIVSDTAAAGFLGIEAIFPRSVRIAGALASVYPATNMITIWNAKVNRLKTPPYHAVTICCGCALGAKTYASSAATKVRITAKT